MNRGISESVVGVEALGLVIFGVDQEHPDTDRLGNLEGFDHEVLQKCRSETASDVSRINGHPCERDGRHLFWLVRCMDFGVDDRSTDAVADA